MAIKTAQDVITLSADLRDYWAPRNRKFEKWYEMIELVDKLLFFGLFCFFIEYHTFTSD